jgi:hypothetical protein|tara:strand:+ start:143 stop:865 length:723 start_codon:yes stop_codon:yes gene_type:complete
MKTFLYPIIFIAIAVSACTHTFDVRLNESSARYQSLAEGERKRVEGLKEINKRLRSQNEMPSGIEIERASNDILLANHFLIRNNTSNDIFVEYEKSSMQFLDRSYRVVSGETRKIDTGRAVPDRIIAAGTSAEVSFYRADDTDSSALFERLNISIKMNEKSYRAVKFDEMSVTSKDFSSVGEVRYINNFDGNFCLFTFWLYGGYCWFIGDAEEEDIEGARKEAAKKYNLAESDFYLVEQK